MKLNNKLIKEILDELQQGLDYDAIIKNDPLEFVYMYDAPQDREVVGFIATCLAHGRVSLFKAVLRRVFDYLGPSPYSFILHSTPDNPGEGNQLDTYYRQSTVTDIRAFLYAVGVVLRRYGSLQGLFARYYIHTDTDYIPALTGFVHEIYSIDLTPFYPDGKLSRGFIQLIPDPAKGSTCKRLHLFLRWMIRTGSPDTGLWDYPTSKLLIPVDTHIAKLSVFLGLTSRKSVDITFAREVGEKLRKYDKNDPVKYDFSLCHIGITDGCPVDTGDTQVNTRLLESCIKCKLNRICQKHLNRL